MALGHNSTASGAVGSYPDASDFLAKLAAPSLPYSTIAFFRFSRPSMLIPLLFSIFLGIKVSIPIYQKAHLGILR